MSRAKEHTHVYVAADDLDQAREDLERDWQHERRWRWAIDTGFGPLRRSHHAICRERSRP